MIRCCANADFPAIEAVINEAAQAYRGVIPADCWHEPYMTGLLSRPRHGFRLVSPAEKDRLLSTYWSISSRQKETSVVLMHTR